MTDVRQGTLDFILTKPEDAQVLVSVREFRIWQSVDVVVGGGRARRRRRPGPGGRSGCGAALAFAVALLLGRVDDLLLLAAR